MDKVKCSIFGCPVIMDVKNNEVKVINVIRDGHRFVCEKHYNYIKENNIKPTIDLIYGTREEKHENKNFFRKRQWLNKPSQDKKN
jgi:hypothetical protein